MFSAGFIFSQGRVLVMDHELVEWRACRPGESEKQATFR